MIVRVTGIGAWGPGFNDWQDLAGMLRGDFSGNEDQPPGPKPEVIPANERRRAPLMVRLAVEASGQAVATAGIASSEIGCVFGSGLGDTDITDYMCRTLNTESKQLSPTKFHNSVHNAAAGYWTISTDCMQSANSIAGFQQTASLTLLEGISQCLGEHRPMLITLFDSPVAEVLKPVLHNDAPFAAAIVIESDNEPRSADALAILRFAVDKPAPGEQNRWSTLEGNAHDSLQPLADRNPAARILGLLELIANEDMSDKTVTMPLSQGAYLIVNRLP